MSARIVRSRNERVAVSHLAGLLDGRPVVAMGQAQESLDHPHALDAAGLDRRLGPAGAVWADQSDAAQQPGGAAFHAGDLLRGDVIFDRC